MRDPDENPQKIQAMLREDLPTPEEADALLPVVLHLRKWQAPSATPEQSAALLAKLTAEMPEARPSPWQRLGESWALLLVRSQVRVVQSEIWIASALVLALGLVLTVIAYQPASPNLPFALIAPIVAAVGVALLYDSDTAQMLELENTTPVSNRLLLLARLTLVFGFNLVLGVVGSLLLALIQTELSLWPLILSWLAPMAFLSALAFLISIVFIDSLAGTVVSLALWGTHVALRILPVETNALTTLLAFPGLNHPDNYLSLVGAALMVIAVSLWLVGHDGWLSKDSV